MARRATRTMSTKAVIRWEYSMMAWYCSGGSHLLAEHLGHPEQPRPDPVARTRPPTATSTKVVAVAAMARVRNGRWDVPGSGMGTEGLPGGARRDSRRDMR